MAKTLVVIDGKSVFYRGYYAMPNLSLRDGTPTGGVYGFAVVALEIISRLKPDYVAVAWDKPKTNIRRRLLIYPQYKAGRKPAPEDFYAQVPVLMELLKVLGWTLFECDDFEADDIMGSLARQAEGKGYETILVSSDLDMLQVVDERTRLFALKTGFSNIEEFDLGHFEEKYGISREQFLDLKALKGDSSDNIPGVAGVGEKTAVKLLRQYGSLEGIFQHAGEIGGAVGEKIRAGEESAYMSRRLSEIMFDAPVKLEEVAETAKMDGAAVRKELERLEFFSLVRKYGEFLGAGAAVGDGANGEVIDEKIVEIEGVEYTKKVVSGGLVVAGDVKELLGVLKYKDVSFYDLTQAEFLLNPLKKVDYGELSLGEMSDIFERQRKEFDEKPKLKKVAFELDFPLIPVLYKMERRGIKIDRERFSELSRQMTAELEQLESEIFQMAGHEFNLNSPLQLAEVLFEELKLPTAGLKKKQRAFSTGAGGLEKLREAHPIIALVEGYREVAKLLNTYIDALPKLADERGRIHTTFTQNVTSTGRLSSVNPNLQNIPVRTEMGRKIRECFVAEEGKCLVAADYSQFELRLAAVLAGDEKLIEDFNAGIDVHTKTASEVFGVPMESVSKEQRRAAKVINFGVLYGMSASGLAAATEMSRGEAAKFIEGYFEVRKPIKDFMERTLEAAKTEGFVETLFGRRRPTPDLNSPVFAVREGAKRAAANMPIQGTEADLMKRAMIRAEERLTGVGEMILQVHDSIMVECEVERAERVGGILREVMEGVAPELAVRLAVDVRVGGNWGEV
jgi:DNA polymerase-1